MIPSGPWSNNSGMTEHDKIEHPLPNGDVLIQDSTRRRPEVEAAFRRVEEVFEREAEQAYRELRSTSTA